jgi:hypothetical protein
MFLKDPTSVQEAINLASELKKVAPKTEIIEDRSTTEERLRSIEQLGTCLDYTQALLTLVCTQGTLGIFTKDELTAYKVRLLHSEEPHAERLIEMHGKSTRTELLRAKQQVIDAVRNKVSI